KEQLSSTDWFDEHRYFTSGTGAKLLRIKSKNIYLAIGADIHGILAVGGAGDLVIYLNAQAFSYRPPVGKELSKRSLSVKLALPLLEVNAVGGQGDMLFEGRSQLRNVEGAVLEEWDA